MTPDIRPLHQPRWATALRRVVLATGEWVMDGLYVVGADKAASWAYTGSRAAAYYIDDRTKRRG